MTDPVKREQKKYRMQEIARQGALIRRIMFWLPIAFFGGIGLLMAIFGRH
jgi:hypothetical protein